MKVFWVAAILVVLYVLVQIYLYLRSRSGKEDLVIKLEVVEMDPARRTKTTWKPFNWRE